MSTNAIHCHWYQLAQKAASLVLLSLLSWVSICILLLEILSQLCSIYILYLHDNQNGRRVLTPLEPRHNYLRGKEHGRGCGSTSCSNASKCGWAEEGIRKANAKLWSVTLRACCNTTDCCTRVSHLPWAQSGFSSSLMELSEKPKGFQRNLGRNWPLQDCCLFAGAKCFKAVAGWAR